jgi:putative phosphoribosyl transferase
MQGVTTQLRLLAGNGAVMLEIKARFLRGVLMRIFRDRLEAGRALGERLSSYAHQSDVIVLGLPRGGVPVALEVARRLGAKLDVLVVRKLGAPGHGELAIGAIASGGSRVFNTDLIARLGISQAEVLHLEATECVELERRVAAYRGDRLFPDLTNRIVILVDDGLATGTTMRAAIATVKTQHPKKLIVAVPVAPQDTLQALMLEVAEVVCLESPKHFYAVALAYEHFEQVSDNEVRAVLTKAREELKSFSQNAVSVVSSA